MVAHHVSRLRNFLEEDLWKIKLQDLPKRKAFFYRQVRIWMITVSEFIKDKCGEKASALTYFSLLSFVPVVAMAFGIAQMFGLKDYVKQELERYFEGQREILAMVSTWADNMLSEAGGGVISGISAVFLIYAVARLLNNIEISFNDIWDTPSNRSLKRMVSDYMSIIMLGPIILIISSSVTVFISSELEEITKSIELLGFFRPLIIFLIRLIPYSLIWFLLFLIYIIFPNTKVELIPALIAGILAGTAYQITQFAWIEGQVYLTKYSDIYGLFAALPLFLIWLQLSWTILLFGAEFAFAIQNVDAWAYDKERLRINSHTKRTLTILILSRIIKYFEKYDQPKDFEELCAELSVPRRFVREVIHDLKSARLIALVVSEDDSELYQPGLDIQKIDLQKVFQKLDEIGMDNLPHIQENEGYSQIVQVLSALDDSIQQSPENKKLLDL